MVEQLNSNLNSAPNGVEGLSRKDLQSVGEKTYEAVSEEDRKMTLEEIRAFVQEYNKNKIAEAPNEARFQATQIRGLEDDFKKQLKRSKERGEKHIKESEFVIWERDFREYWVRLQDQVHLGGLDANVEATAESPMMLSYDDQSVLAETIEAQSAHFFHKRLNELLGAIRTSGNKDAKRDIDIAFGLRETALEHINWRTMPISEIRKYGMKEADRARISAHNNLIIHFNTMNDLAEKYGTTRFTPRNFWFSNPDQKQPVDIEKRMRNDRDIVEEYYQIAFEPEYRDAMKRFERDKDLW